MGVSKKKTETETKPKTKKTTTNKTKKTDGQIITGSTGDIVEEVKKQIEAVNTEINVEYNNLDNITDEIKGELEPINEIIEETDKISEKKKELESIMSTHPNDADAFIKKELENAEELKDKIQKIMSSPSKKSFNHGFTTWWNGSSLDFLKNV